MGHLIILIAVIIVIAVIIASKLFPSEKSKGDAAKSPFVFHYGRKDYFMSRSENEFFNQTIMAFGAITPAIFGFDPCQEDPGQSGPQFLFGVQMKPLFIEIKEKLLDPPPADAIPEVQLAGLQSLQRLIDRDDFLPDMPEQRDYLLMLIHSKYSELTKDNWEDERHIKKALAIAKEHRLIVPTVSIYLGLGNNQAKRKVPLTELIKTTRKAFAAAEVCLDRHVSVEASRITVAANLMIMYLEARGDEEGMSKIEQRLANRGLRAVTDAPSAATPWLN